MALILRPRTAREYWLSGMQATDFIERNYVDDERIAYCRGSAPIKLLSSMSMQRCATFPVALRRNGRADGHPPCANEALKVVANGAASPREAILTQLLSAPLNRGGIRPASSCSQPSDRDSRGNEAVQLEIVFRC